MLALFLSINITDKDKLAIVRFPDAIFGVSKRHLLVDVAALDKMHLHSNDVTDIIDADAVAYDASRTNF